MSCSHVIHGRPRTEGEHPPSEDRIDMRQLKPSFATQRQGVSCRAPRAASISQTCIVEHPRDASSELNKPLLRPRPRFESYVGRTQLADAH